MPAYPPATATATAAAAVAAAAAAAQVEKAVRLMVKRRLFARESGGLSDDAVTRKRQLDDLYQDLMRERYAPVLPRLRAACAAALPPGRGGAAGAVAAALPI